MSTKLLIFKLIDQKPSIPNIEEYYYQIICYDTKFKDYIYCNKFNEITDTIDLKKPLKYIIKLMKKGKILAVGNFIITQELFIKKIKKKKYNNINLFITENNYKKIFPNINPTFTDNLKKGLLVSLEISIKYIIAEEGLNNNAKNEKYINYKKIKLIKKNFSFQGKKKLKNEYSVKCSNNYFTTSTSFIKTYNNIFNNCYENDNYNFYYNENNLNFLSSDKYSITTPSYMLSPTNLSCPFSEPNIQKNKKKLIKKGIISSISFKNNNSKNKKYKIYSNNIRSNLLNLGNKLNENTSRNKKFIFNKKKINYMITSESSSSKNSNSNSQSSIIDSAFIEKNDNNNFEYNEFNNNSNLNNNDDFINRIINNNAYNKDNDDNDYILIDIEMKINKILKEQDKMNRKLFNQEQLYNKLYNSLKTYENKIKNNQFIIDKFKEKIDILKNKESIYNINCEIIPLITKVKESKDIENDIFNLILKNNNNNNNIIKKNNTIENNIEKYNRNLMIKIIKNVIQNNHNIDKLLNEDKKKN